MSEEILLDVHDLEPPEPYEQATAALRGLRPAQYLKLLIHRRPRLLYPWLTEHGFAERTRQLADDRFEIYIWRESDRPCGEFVSSKLTQ